MVYDAVIKLKLVLTIVKFIVTDYNLFLPAIRVFCYNEHCDINYDD